MRLEEFVRKAGAEASSEAFDLENSKLLDVEVDGHVFVKADSMIANEGDIEFVGISSAEGGIGGFIKEKMTSEGTPVMKAEGNGHVYVADQGKRIQVIELGEGETLSVNGDDILAFDDKVNYEISTMDSLSGVTAGGFTNVYLTGPGMIAITSHGEPLILQPPVKTDPNATVAWSGDISPSSSINASLGDMIGQSSGEFYQMEFEGSEGFVVVQPFEENSSQNQGN